MPLRKSTPKGRISAKFALSACLMICFCVQANAGLDYTFTSNGGTLEFVTANAIQSNVQPLTGVTAAFAQGSADFTNSGTSMSADNTVNLFTFATATLNGLSGTYDSVVFEFDNVPFPQTPGTYQGNVTFTASGGQAGSPVTGSLTITDVDPTFTIDFGGATVPEGGAATVTFTITNNAAVALTGIGFSDALPNGVSVQEVVSNTCGGTLTANTGDTNISLADGSLPVGGNCGIQLSVQAAQSGALTSTTSAITTDQTGVGPTASASVSVMVPPTLSTGFGAADLEEGTTGTLTFVIANPNALGLTGVSFTDVLPAGMTLANTSFSDTCSGQNVSFTGTNQISFSGTVAANATCQISVNVEGNSLGSYTDSTSVISSNEGGSGAAASAGVVVGTPPSFIDFFGASTIPLNGTTTLVFSIDNPNGVAVTGSSFTDTLPAGLQLTSTSLTDTCAGTTATVSAPNEISVSGDIAPNESCTIIATVQGVAAGTYTDTSSPLTGGLFGDATAASANLVVVAPPGLAAAFAVPSIAVGGGTSLVFTVTNPNAVALTGVGFSDALPTGLQWASTPLVNTCSALSANITASGITVSGSLAASESCTITAGVTDLAPGSLTDMTSTITSNEGGNGTASSAGIAAIAPPALTESFNGATVPLSGAMSLTFTIVNPNGTPLTGVSFTDTLPSGMTLANTTYPDTCSGQNVTFTGTNQISFSGTVAANATCQISVNVAAGAIGSYTDNSSVISSNEGGSGAAASAGVVVGTPLSFIDFFGASTIPLNGTTTLVFSIGNPNGVAVTGSTFTDTLPAGLQLTSTSLTDTCAGTTATVSAQNEITLSGDIAPNSSCTVTASVQGVAAGTYTDTSSPLTGGLFGDASAASANLAVVAAPTLSAAFASPSVAEGGSTSLVLTVTNPNAVALTGVGFTDALPTGLQWASTPLVNNCSALSANVTGSGITVSGSLAASEACTITVPVIDIAPGSLTDTTSTITSNEGGNGTAASAGIAAVAPPGLSEAFGNATVPLKATVSLTFTIVNANGTPLTGVGFTDALPSGMTLANTTYSDTCSGQNVTFTGSNQISFSGTVAANATCQINVNVAGGALGSYTDTTSAIASNEGGSGAAASASVTIGSPPNFIDFFGAGTIPLNGTTTLVFSIDNINGVAVTGAAFTDTLPTGLQFASTSLTDSCAGTTATVSAPNEITFSGDIAPNAFCTVIATVQGVSAGTYTNTTSPLAGLFGNAGAASANLSVVAAPRVAAAFTPPSVAVGGSTSLVLTVTNPNAVVLTGVGFSDALPTGLQWTSTQLVDTCSALSANVTASTITVSGSLAANESCTITAAVTDLAPGSLTDATSAITSNEGGSGAAVTASIAAVAPPALSEAFGAATVPLNGTVPLTFTVVNANGTPLTGVSFTDALPSGMTLANTTFSDTCSGQSVTFTGSNQISFTGAVAGKATCQIGMNVAGSSLGTFTNSTSVIASNEGGSGAAASASITVGSPPNFIDFFGASTIALNGTTTLVFSIENPNSVAVTGSSFTDTLPAGLQFASTSLTNSCSGTTATVSAPSEITFSGAIAPNAFCTVIATVQGITAGTYTDTSSPLTGLFGNAAAASANLSVVAPPSLTAAFAPASVAVGGGSSLTFTITNPNAVALTGVGFTDALPAGLQLPSSPLGDGCSALSANVTSGAISISGSLAASESCKVTAALVDITAGSLTDMTSAITSKEGGNGTAATAIIGAIAPPALSEVFAAPTVPLNGTVLLTFTIVNANATPLTGVAFTDALPAGLQLVNATLVTTCSGGTASATTSELISFSGTLAPNSSCTVSASVDGNVAGSLTNTTSGITSNEAGSGNAASASISVAGAPTLSAAFTGATVPLNGVATLTFTIGNRNGIPLTGVGFSDTLPAGLQLASVALTNMCAGTSATASSLTVITFSGTLAANASCTVTANVKGLSAGTYSDATTTIASNEGGNGAAATAGITVMAPPTLREVFGSGSIAVNGSTSLTFTIANPNTLPLTGVTFTDSFPTGLQLANTTLTTTCAGASATATSPVSLTFSATVGAGVSCTVIATVEALAAGSYTNTTSAITSNEGGTGSWATATLGGIAPPTLSEAFGASSVLLNGTTSLTFTLSNPNATALTGVAFTDTLPTGLLLAGSTFTNACANLTPTATTTSVITVSGSLAGNASCTITAVVKMVAVGSYTNTTSAIASNEGGSGAAASASLGVFGQPTLSEAFTPATIVPGGSSTLSFTIANSTSTSATGLTFTDVLPSGVLIATGNAVSNTCNGSATAQSSNNTVSLTGGTLSGSGTCTVSVTVTAQNEGTYSNISSALSSNEGGTGANASASLIVATPLGLTESFSAVALPMSASAVLSFTITNSNQQTALTGITFTDTLPAGLQVSNPNGITGTCGSATINATAGGNTIGVSGGSLAAASNCTFSVNVTASATGRMTNTTGPVSSDQTGTGPSASATITAGSVFSVAYAANLSAGDSLVDLVNPGENGAMLYGPGLGEPTGNICANIYALSPDEQLEACCSCLITPGALASLSVKNDLLINTYTAAVPTSVVIKIITTLAGANGSSTSCNNSAATLETPVSGIAAWRTTLHPKPAGDFAITETPFTQATLSSAELQSLTNRCAFLIGNGSGMGICNSCRTYGLGAERSTE